MNNIVDNFLYLSDYESACNEALLDQNHISLNVNGIHKQKYKKQCKTTTKIQTTNNKQKHKNNKQQTKTQKQQTKNIKHKT